MGFGLVEFLEFLPEFGERGQFVIGSTYHILLLVAMVKPLGSPYLSLLYSLCTCKLGQKLRQGQ